jgi:hypothetical protein
MNIECLKNILSNKKERIEVRNSVRKNSGDLDILEQALEQQEQERQMSEELLHLSKEDEAILVKNDDDLNLSDDSPDAIHYSTFPIEDSITRDDKLYVTEEEI